MSQYAFYLKKKRQSPSARFLFLRKSRRIHNGYELDKVFGIQEKNGLFPTLLYYFYLALDYKKSAFIARPLQRLFGLLGCTVRHENDNYDFQMEMVPVSRGVKYFVGGWHSERYFSDIREQVLDSFQFDTAAAGPANLAILERIRACNSVSVHVRRGDFLDAQNYGKFGAVCTLGYFEKAIATIRSAVDHPHFFFFTNDQEWVKDHFQDAAFTVVDINSGADSWKDMCLMSNCTHNIASNGSFSWWAAWLNRNPDKTVIVPKYFVAGRDFEDIYPASWTRLTDY